ncbi:DUF3180 domain-containing protein [Curtobacterium sp. MCLR17_007]|uniref:DUF3180 domain-containing protein n=1 Tax=unclassified Curtobacterium TaxID=257496 RepID=UPI0006FD7952|nr:MULTISPECIES: DUF3180 domain-containing protein [unclassified Curtobacterium]KQS06154.1 hypothetical protein ASG04_16485 [Curtobacterium sp. Leaf183]WIB60390.1 DUF3180 domain-containing protein [Curtobacterium sp. MCLR17_007]
MKTTRASTLISLAVVAGIAGFALNAALASRQAPALLLVSPLGFALALIGVVLIALALPVRRHAQGVPGRRVDPIYATRVVVLAKASSICGVLFGAFALGLLVYLLTRSVVPSLGSTLPSAVAVGGGIVLTVCALVAERMCIAPPDDDDPDDPRGGTTAR